MSDLYVDLESLNTAAEHADTAANESGKLRVSDSMGTVSSAMKGGSSGGAAASAGMAIDDASSKMTAGLEVFRDSLQASASNYNQTDGSTSADFKGVESALNGDGDDQ